MQRKRWKTFAGRFGVVLAIAGMLASGLPAPRLNAIAQDRATPGAESPAASPVASPLASPVASPVAFTPASNSPVFVSAGWRFSLIFATRIDAVPELDLTSRVGREWIVVVADAGNWSTKKATFKPGEFGVRVTGEETAGGFAKQTTQTAAEQLGVEPTSINKGVTIDAGKSKRLVLVFRIDAGGAEPFLVYGEDSMPLNPVIAQGGSILSLPAAAPLPTLDSVDVKRTIDGRTLELGDGIFTLAGVDSPVGAECFASQATRRLERLASNEVLIENGADPSHAYVWAQDTDGRRTLINHSVIADGSAAFLEGSSGIYSAWLQDADRIARNNVEGLWASCTNQHGAAREQKPETTGLTMESDGQERDYEVWVAWAPLIVTKPDGSAWVFYSAEPASGKDEGNKRLYSSHYDPATGLWSASTVMPGGLVQMGPSAVVDADGIVHLVFCDRARDEEGSYSEIRYTHEDGNGGWTDPVPVARESSSGYQLSPSLTIDELGVLHVLWQDQRAFSSRARDESPANADIFASDLAPGGEWSKPVLVNTHYIDAAGSRPHVVTDGNRLIAVWSVYAASLGLGSAARVEWSSRPVDDPLGWTAPQVLVVGRGEAFGGRLLDLAADPTGGVVLVYGRQANDTFLFLRRLKPGADEWGGDTLLTFGDRGTYPSVTVNDEGVVYVVYNVGAGNTVDVGAVAIPYRSIEPGPEVILTEDQPNTQGRPIVATDVTGRPWIVYFNEPPGGVSNEVRVLRNAIVPTKAE